MKKAISYLMLFSILLSFVVVFTLQVKADEPTTELEKFVVKLNGYLDPALQLSVDGDKLVSNHNDPYGEKYVVQPDFDNNAITVLCSGPSQDSQYVPDNVGIQVEYSSETGASVTALGDIEIEGAVAKVEAPVFEAATTSSNYAPVVHEYTITWVVDGNSTEEVYTEGSMPSYKGATPTKDGYTFTGWSPAVSAVTGDATYTAQFTRDTYTVTLKVFNTTYSTTEVSDGEMFYLPYINYDNANSPYSMFAGASHMGWDISLPEGGYYEYGVTAEYTYGTNVYITVTGDITLYAIYEENGCFLEGSPVLMADGTYKNIENIEIGDKVMSYNVTTGQYYATNVIYVCEEIVTNSCYEVTLADGTIIYPTINHPIYTIEGFKTIATCGAYDTLSVGDYVFTVNGYVEVADITALEEGKRKVYNLGVTDDDEDEDDDTNDTFIVHSVVVHNVPTHSG